MSKENNNRVTSRIKWRWIIAAAIGIAIGLLVLFHERTPSPHESLQVTSSAVGEQLPISSPPRSRSTQNPPAPKSNGTFLLPVEDKNGENEICGVGKIPLETDDPEEAHRFSEAFIKKARERWRAALLNSDDYRARAVGLFLRSSNSDDGPAKLIDVQSLGDLVQLARGARDPAVYAIALHWCRNNAAMSGASGCEQLSLSEWARIDPDNAIPWLLLAGEAQKQNNSVAEADAFDHIAKSKKSDGYDNSLYAFAQASFPDDLISVERAVLSVEMIGLQAALSEPQYGIASRHCSVEAIKDSKVRQDCDALAKLWLEKGTTLLDFSIGQKIAERVGWSKNRLRVFAQERDAIGQVMGESLGNIDFRSCQNVQRFNDYFAQLASLGEVGAARDAIARSGQSVSELAEKQTAAQEEAKRAIEQENAKSESVAP